MKYLMVDNGRVFYSLDDKDNLSVMTVDKDIVAGSEIG